MSDSNPPLATQHLSGAQQNDLHDAQESSGDLSMTEAVTGTADYASILDIDEQLHCENSIADSAFLDKLNAFLSEGMIHLLLNNAGIPKGSFPVNDKVNILKKKLELSILRFDGAIRQAAELFNGVPVSNVRQLAIDAYCAFGAKGGLRKENLYNVWSAMNKGKPFDEDAVNQAAEAKGVRLDDTSRSANGTRLGLSNRVKVPAYYELKQDDQRKAALIQEMANRQQKTREHAVLTGREAEKLIKHIENLMDSLDSYGYGALFYVADGHNHLRKTQSQLRSSKVTSLGADFDLILRTYRFGADMFSDCVQSAGWMENVLRYGKVPFVETQLFKMLGQQTLEEWRKCLEDDPQPLVLNAQTRQTQQRAQFSNLLRDHINTLVEPDKVMQRLPSSEKFDRALAKHGLRLYFKVPENPVNQRFTRTQLVYYPTLCRQGGSASLSRILLEEWEAGNIRVATSNPWSEESATLVDCPGHSPGVYQAGSWLRGSHHTADDDRIINDHSEGPRKKGKTVSQRASKHRENLRKQNVPLQAFDSTILEGYDFNVSL